MHCASIAASGKKLDISTATLYLLQLNHFMIVVFTDLLDYYLLTIITRTSMYESFAIFLERATNNTTFTTNSLRIGQWPRSVTISALDSSLTGQKFDS